MQVHCFDCCACQTMNAEPIIPSHSGQSTRGGGVHFHCFDWCIFKQRTLSKWNNFLFKWMYFLIYRVLKAKYFWIFFHLRTKYWQSATSIIGCLFHSGSDNLMSSWFSLKLYKSEVNNWNTLSKCTSTLGTGQATKTDEFSEKFQTAFDPPPSHFRKIILRIF